jgi:hypothetical protein
MGREVQRELCGPENPGGISTGITCETTEINDMVSRIMHGSGMSVKNSPSVNTGSTKPFASAAIGNKVSQKTKNLDIRGRKHFFIKDRMQRHQRSTLQRKGCGKNNSCNFARTSTTTETSVDVIGDIPVIDATTDESRK